MAKVFKHNETELTDSNVTNTPVEPSNSNEIILGSKVKVIGSNYATGETAQVGLSLILMQ